MKSLRIVLIDLLAFTGSSFVEANKARGTCTYTLTDDTVRTKQTSQTKCQRKYTASNNRQIQGTTQWASAAPKHHHNKLYHHRSRSIQS